MNAISIDARKDAMKKIIVFRSAMMTHKAMGDDKAVLFVYRNAMQIFGKRIENAKTMQDAKEYAKAMDQINVAFGVIDAI